MKASAQLQLRRGNLEANQPPERGLREFPLRGENFAWRRENFC